MYHKIGFGLCFSAWCRNWILVKSSQHFLVENLFIFSGAELFHLVLILVRSFVGFMLWAHSLFPRLAFLLRVWGLVTFPSSLIHGFSPFLRLRGLIYSQLLNLLLGFILYNFLVPLVVIVIKDDFFVFNRHFNFLLVLAFLILSLLLFGFEVCLIPSIIWLLS